MNTVRISLVLVLLAGGSLARAGGAYLGPALRGMTRQAAAGRLPVEMTTPGGPFAVRLEGRRPLVRLLLLAAEGVERDLPALEAKRVRRFGPVVALELPLDRVRDLARLPGVISARLSRRLRPHLDRSVPVLPAPSTGIELTRTLVDQSGHQTTPPPWTTGSGSGVVFGLVDSGIDIDHQDFSDSAGNSRILWYWDQNSSAECTGAQIDAGSCSLTDSGIGHGSHVSGIGAGSGRGTGNGLPQYQYVGVAPEADIVAVATDFYDDGILDGAAYVFDKARSLGRPAVVNMSLGGHYGPHDGTDPLDLGLDAMTGPGQVIVVSAGNEGGDYIHDQATWSGSDVSFDFVIQATGLGLHLYYDVWHQGGDSFSVTIREPKNSSRTCNPGNNCTWSLGQATVQVVVPAAGQTDPGNGDKEIIVQLYGSARTGTWRMTFSAQSVDSSDGDEIHAWQYYDDRADYGYPSYFSSGDNDYSVGSPGTAKSVITVGAYTSKAIWWDINGDDWGYGYTEDDISPFSSLGPTRDGRLKPDVAAPGSAIASALFSGYSPDVRRKMPDGVHWVIDGTSMSSPHVAGFAALLLALDPLYGPRAVKSLVAWQADRDAYVGAAPSYTWGHGKLHADDTLAAAAADLPRCSTAAAEPGGNRDSAATLVATTTGFSGYQSSTPRYLYRWQQLRTSGGYSYFENISGATHRRLEPQAFAAGQVLRLVATPYEWLDDSGYSGLLLGASCVEEFTVASGSTPRSHAGGLSWHMVAIPTQDDDAVLGDFSEPFYLWNEALQQYQQAGSVQQGRGYWVEVQPGEGAMHSNGAAATAADYVTPQLTYTTDPDFRPGRHLLGNPFSKPIWWQNTCVSTDGSTCLAGVTEAAAGAYVHNVYYADYDNDAGSYHYYDPADFEELDGKIFPWQGFWVVVKQPVYLIIPDAQPDPDPAAVSPPYPLVPAHPAGVSGPVPAARTLAAGPVRPGARTGAAWRVKLSVSAGRLGDGYNYLGIDPRARDGYDPLDLPDAGTMNQGHVMLWFPHDDWGKLSGRYCTDMRRPGPDIVVPFRPGKWSPLKPQLPDKPGVERWNFVVDVVGVDGEVSLRWHGVPGNWLLRLHDETAGLTINMNHNPVYRFRPAGEVERRRFTVTALPGPATRR